MKKNIKKDIVVPQKNYKLTDDKIRSKVQLFSKAKYWKK